MRRFIASIETPRGPYTTRSIEVEAATYDEAWQKAEAQLDTEAGEFQRGVNEVPVYTIDMPGAFECFWTGTGVAQGQRYSDDADLERGALELKLAYEQGQVIPRGKGRSIRLTLPSEEAVQVLWEYAAVLLDSNLGGDQEHTEMRAARNVMARCVKAVGKELTW